MEDVEIKLHPDDQTFTYEKEGEAKTNACGDKIMSVATEICF